MDVEVDLASPLKARDGILESIWFAIHYLTPTLPAGWPLERHHRI